MIHSPVNHGKPSRLIAVSISGELLQQWITEGRVIGTGRAIYCMKGLPEGAQYRWSYSGQGIVTPDTIFVFEHKSFNVVQTGEKIPMLSCEFQERDA